MKNGNEILAMVIMGAVLVTIANSLAQHFREAEYAGDTDACVACYCAQMDYPNPCLPKGATRITAYKP